MLLQLDSQTLKHPSLNTATFFSLPMATPNCLFDHLHVSIRKGPICVDFHLFLGTKSRSEAQSLCGITHFRVAGHTLKRKVLSEQRAHLLGHRRVFPRDLNCLITFKSKCRILYAHVPSLSIELWALLVSTEWWQPWAWQGSTCTFCMGRSVYGTPCAFNSVTSVWIPL
jgi:hypothetical protein